MKFTIIREQLLKPLQLVNNVVERRQTLPILGNVLLNTDAGKLQLIGTDLEVEVSAKTDLLSTEENGSVTVPAKKLFDICRSLPENTELTFETDNHKLLIQSGRSRFNLTTLPAIEFPTLKPANDGVGFSLARTELKRLVDSTQFAMAQQDVRYYLNGSLWHLENNQLISVATDGHRLALDSIPVLNESEPELNAKQIVPRKAIIEIGRIISEAGDNIDVILGVNYLQFKVDEFVLSTKLIDGRFPDYQRVIPRNNEFKMTVDKDELKQLLSRVAILSNEKYRGVRLTVTKDNLKVIANNPEHEQAEEELAVNYDGDSIEIALNVTYILDALNTLPKGEVSFLLGNSDTSVLIESLSEDNQSLNVIMPMRL